MKRLNIYFDGGNAGGIATWAVLVKDNEKVIAKLTGLVDPSLPQTNNVAEWKAIHMAVIYALAQQNNTFRFDIHGDSELVIKQINGEYATTNPNIRPIYDEVKKLLINSDILHYFTFQWIPREENKEADELGRELRK